MYFFKFCELWTFFPTYFLPLSSLLFIYVIFSVVLYAYYVFSCWSILYNHVHINIYTYYIHNYCTELCVCVYWLCACTCMYM